MGEQTPGRSAVVTALGIVQILAWGTSFYFPAVLAAPIVADTGWSLSFVVGGVSLGLLTAGLLSPRVGRAIARHGGRPVLTLSSLCYAGGLAVIGLAPTLPIYVAGWIVLGVGMGTGLYDAVFAALGRLYGHDARGAITNLTLFGGFASTVCWPLSAFLADACGWRGACLVYAALHLAVALPLQRYALRGSSGQAAPARHEASTPPLTASTGRDRLLLVLLAAVMTLAAAIGAIVVVHLIVFLRSRGADLATAVALGTLFGPAQVGARVVERLFGRHYHPIWTMIGACLLMMGGLWALLIGGVVVLAPAIAVYGAGYGVSWIARGTLPLALFGPERYAVLMGHLALPSLIAQALAPSVGALLIDQYGVDAAIVTLTALAAVNVTFVWMLWALISAKPDHAPH